MSASLTSPAFYDIFSLLPPGLVMTRELMDGLEAAYAANGGQPLTAEQIEAVTGPALPYPTGLKRLPDSNLAPEFTA